MDATDPTRPPMDTERRLGTTAKTSGPMSRHTQNIRSGRSQQSPAGYRDCGSLAFPDFSCSREYFATVTFPLTHCTDRDLTSDDLNSVRNEVIIKPYQASHLKMKWRFVRVYQRTRKT